MEHEAFFNNGDRAQKEYKEERRIITFHEIRVPKLIRINEIDLISFLICD